MKIAITGATGFIGRHLARTLSYRGHELILIARGRNGRGRTLHRLHNATFIPLPIDDEDGLEEAFAGCDAVYHCAGIHRESGPQTFQKVHVDGTRAVVEAVRRAQVPHLTLMSFLRARPDCGARFHESKWQAEEIVRASGLNYTILKSGLVYGRGDHLLDHLTRSLLTIRMFALVGWEHQPLRPVAIEDLIRVLEAAPSDARLSRRTLPVLGPHCLPFSDVVCRVARAIDRRVYLFPMPVWFHRLLAFGLERAMRIPFISLAQVRMLAEGIAEPLPGSESLPAELEPQRPFSIDQIRAGLPDLRGLTLAPSPCECGNSLPVRAL